MLREVEHVHRFGEALHGYQRHGLVRRQPAARLVVERKRFIAHPLTTLLLAGSLIGRRDIVRSGLSHGDALNLVGALPGGGHRGHRVVVLDAHGDHIGERGGKGGQLVPVAHLGFQSAGIEVDVVPAQYLVQLGAGDGESAGDSGRGQLLDLDQGIPDQHREHVAHEAEEHERDRPRVLGPQELPVAVHQPFQQKGVDLVDRRPALADIDEQERGEQVLVDEDLVGLALLRGVRDHLACARRQSSANGQRDAYAVAVGALELLSALQVGRAQALDQRRGQRVYRVLAGLAGQRPHRFGLDVYGHRFRAGPVAAWATGSRSRPDIPARSAG